MTAGSQHPDQVLGDQARAGFGPDVATTTIPLELLVPRPVERAVTFAVLLTGLRCVVQYVILPFVLPWVGLAATVPSWVTLALGAVALASLARAVHHLWRLHHAQRWNYLCLGLVLTVALLLFIGADLRALFS